MIPVTKPFLPPQEDYKFYVDAIWNRNWLTNNGPLVNKLELQLKEYLHLEHLLFVSNGTIALQIAIKALDLKGEIITTPFSYVATTSSIAWEGCTPVFADIDPHTLNIDPNKIEAVITSQTSAILATHVFGNPCAIEAIQAIADKYGLKVIYDAAHAFGVTYKGRSIFEYGDISTTSFHATKLFHTIEGGAVFTKNTKVLRKLALLRNFGHTTPTSFGEIGINGKNSEFHAAMGLCNLPHITSILQKRKELSRYYTKRLNYFNISRPSLVDSVNYNYAYYPVLFKNEIQLLQIKEHLEKYRIYARRYFYPSLSSLEYVPTIPTPIADDIASRILCLPLYHTLSKEEIDFVCRILTKSKSYSLDNNLTRVENTGSANSDNATDRLHQTAS